MPFVEVDPVQEARELQEEFKDYPEIAEKYRQFELAHIEARNMTDKFNKLPKEGKVKVIIFIEKILQEYDIAV